MKLDLRIITICSLLLLHNTMAMSNLSDTFSNSIDNLFGDRNLKPGCAVGVIEDGKYIHKRGYGFANLEHEVKIDEDTIFRIGSVSKQFTTMAIAILEEKGLLSFKDEMKTHIPLSLIHI